MTLTPYQDAHRAARAQMKADLADKLTSTDEDGTLSRTTLAIVDAVAGAMAAELDAGKPYALIMEGIIAGMVNAAMSTVGTLTGGHDENGNVHRPSANKFLSDFTERFRAVADMDLRRKNSAAQIEVTMETAAPIEGASKQ